MSVGCIVEGFIAVKMAGNSRGCKMRLRGCLKIGTRIFSPPVGMANAGNYENLATANPANPAIRTRSPKKRTAAPLASGGFKFAPTSWGGRPFSQIEPPCSQVLRRQGDDPLDPRFLDPVNYSFFGRSELNALTSRALIAMPRLLGIFVSAIGR